MNRHWSLPLTATLTPHRIERKIEKEILNIPDEHTRQLRLLEYSRLDYLTMPERRIYLKNKMEVGRSGTDADRRHTKRLETHSECLTDGGLTLKGRRDPTGYTSRGLEGGRNGTDADRR